MNTIVADMLDPAVLAPERVHPLERVEYEALVASCLTFRQLSESSLSVLSTRR